jgi:prevent-host-death family protein
VSQPETISISELRKHTSRYLAMVKTGKRVAITVRGELVAYLVPARSLPTAPGLAPATPQPSSTAATPNAAE